MRQILFASLIAIFTVQLTGCCSVSSGLAGGGCTDGGLAMASPAVSLPSLTAGLPPLAAPAPQACDANCNAALSQGYMHGFSFGSAVSCGIRQVAAIPLAAVTFVGGTAEALLGGLGTVCSMNYAQTTSTLSNGYAADYTAEDPCTCDACSAPALSLPAIPMLQSPAQFGAAPAVQGCAPCGTAAPQYMNTMPADSYPVGQPVYTTPGSVPPPIPGIQGAVPMAPPASPVSVPLPRDANSGTQSTTYLLPNRGQVMATSF